jgi:two-component system, sensor histidine kinase
MIQGVTTGEDNIRRAARALAEIAHALAAADQAEERLRATLRLVQHMVPYECCALLEVIPKNGRCELYTVPELSAEQRTALRGRLIALLRMMGDDPSELPVDVDGSGDAEAAASEPHAAAGSRMHLAIPVIGLNQIIGVLFVEQSAQPFEEPYDEHSLRLLSVVAAQLGSYLTSLRLRQEEIEHARQLGIALRQLEETDRRKDDFLAMLGHELRNPIGAINNALRIIDHKHDDPARYHRLIDRQIRHLSRIVDDLLDASRVRLGKIVLEHRPIDLRVVAERWNEAFGQTALAQSHELQLTIPDQPVAVQGDAVRLEQIFSNILTNALKYTPPGGRIAITIAQEDGDGVIRVRDTGIGMEPKVLATVFDLFTQADESLSRSQGGLGLGLPLVRSLVEQHGGTVQALSDGLGKGSEFIVRIPLTTHVADLPSENVRVQAQHPGSALRVLLIEDNEDACETLKTMLTLWGHEVECASDGLQGVTKALAERPDAMLVDIGLPQLDGYEVARRTRAELGANTPTMIAMTGYGQPEDRRRAIDAGFDAHMVKPINAFELRDRLAAVRPQPKGT